MSMNNYGETPKSTRIYCGKSRTKQSFADGADINKIVARYKKTKTFENVNSVIGQYADVADIKSYQDGMQQQIETKEMFAELPAHVREFFRNDPVELLKFVIDEKNRDKAIELGLIKPPKMQGFSTQAIKEIEANAPATTDDTGEPPVSTEAKPKVEPKAS